MKRSVGRRTAIRALGAAAVAGLAGCSGSGDGDEGDTSGSEGSTAESTEVSETEGATPTGTPSEPDLKAAFVHDTPIGDLGWTTAHHNARMELDAKYDWLETDFSQEVPPTDFRRVAEDYARRGYDVIYGTTFGYMDPMFELSQEYPDIYWENATGFKTREPNMGRYFGRYYEPRYLQGVAAGMLSETNRMGYIGAFPIGSNFREINALILGARSVNPEMELLVRWVNSWHDPPKAQQAAQSLIDEGVDFTAQITDSPAGVRTAARNGVWGTGVYSSMASQGGDTYVNSAMANWIEYYEPQTLEIRNGNYTANAYWKGLESGVVGFDEWGPQVPEEVKEEVASVREGIVSGGTDVWAGSKFEGKSDEFLFKQMSSYVEGVRGTPPE